MAIKFQNLTVSTTAVGFTVPAGIVPNKAVLSIQDSGISVRLDGTDATAANGNYIQIGDPFEVHGLEAIEAFTMIRATSTDAIINVHFFDGNNYITTNGG